MTKNGQKMAQKHGFWTFLMKIMSLFLSGSCVK